MKKQFFLPITLLISTFFYFGQTNTDSVMVDHYVTKKFDVALFPPVYYFPDVTPEIFGKIADNFFTPSRKEVDKAEQALTLQLESINKAFDPHIPIYKKLSKFRRQYFGSIDSCGHRILLINCFWKNNDSGKNWLMQRIDVYDGGWHYWRVAFDLDTGKLFGFETNGTA
ncbi:MAG: hypothetical protein IT236_18765 [Bacteroidia bacterium]|nr:hypothetical protein [Bacteroidia bacterium]